MRGVVTSVLGMIIDGATARGSFARASSLSVRTIHVPGETRRQLSLQTVRPHSATTELPALYGTTTTASFEGTLVPQAFRPRIRTK